MAARYRFETAHSARRSPSLKGLPQEIGSVLQAVLQRYGVTEPATVSVVQTPAEPRTPPATRWNWRQERLF